MKKGNAWTSRIPPKMMEIYLKHKEGKTVKQISMELEVSRSYVYDRINTAKRRIQHV